MGGLTNLEFETLWAILAAEDWSAQKHALVAVGEGEDWWLFKFPAPFVEELRKTGPSGISAAAAAWAATEEISGAASDVEPVIKALVALAQSVSGERGMFVWTSL